MKKIIIALLLVVAFCLTGCSSGSIDDLNTNMKKMELTGNLITYKAYYHTVIEYEKEKGSGITHLFEKDRKMFIEYTATIKLGIDMSKVKVDVKENEINVFIPKATIIGEANVDRNNFKEENIIESKEGLNKNKITLEDSNAVFEAAQKSIKSKASKDKELLSLAQKRAKVILEENIRSLSELEYNQYTINWEYGQ